MNKRKGILTAFISVVLIIATLLTATVFTACDGISDPDSNLSASAVTETPADKFADKSVDSSAEILSRAPTPEPTLTQTGKMPYQSPAPTPDVKHTPNPTPVATRTPDPTPIRTAPPSLVLDDYAEYCEYMLDVLYGEIILEQEVYYSNKAVLVYAQDGLHVYDEVEKDGSTVVGYTGFIRDLPIGLLEFAEDLTAYELDSAMFDGAIPGETAYNILLFDSCIAIRYGKNYFHYKYILLGTDDDWETYYHIKTPEESGINPTVAAFFHCYQNGTMFYGTELTGGSEHGIQVSYSLDRGINWTLCEIDLLDIKYVDSFGPGEPVFDGEKGIMPMYAHSIAWDQEYFMLIFTTEDGGKTWTFSEELSL